MYTSIYLIKSNVIYIHHIYIYLDIDIYLYISMYIYIQSIDIVRTSAASCIVSLSPPQYLHHNGMQFLDLPQEVILRVFECLTIPETFLIAESLGSSRHPKVEAIEKLLWATRCSRTIVISPTAITSNNTKSNHVSPQAAHSMLKQLMRHSLVPSHLVFELSRSPRDYVKFQNSMSDVWVILESEMTSKQLLAIPKLEFVILGNIITTESPTLLVSLILNTLVKLARLSTASWTLLNISLTDLGDYFPHKWGPIFEGFSHCEELILRDNLIRLSSPHQETALLETEFRWPPNLRKLILSNNLIRNFLSAAIKKLPKSLEVLDLANNSLEHFAERPSIPLQHHLPNMSMLNLSGNNSLCLLEPQLLQDSVHLPRKLTINLKNSNVYGPLLASLVIAAEKENVRIVI